MLFRCGEIESPIRRQISVSCPKMGRFRPPNCFGRGRLPGDRMLDGLRGRTSAQRHASMFRRPPRQEDRVVAEEQTDQGIDRRGHFAGSILADAVDELFQPGACGQFPGYGLVPKGRPVSHRLLYRWQWIEWAVSSPLRPGLRSGQRREIWRSGATQLSLSPSRRVRAQERQRASAAAGWRIRNDAAWSEVGSGARMNFARADRSAISRTPRVAHGRKPCPAPWRRRPG